jgi:glycosyltransferase involved in cell wall biosynthesis
MGLTLWTNSHGTAQTCQRAGVPITWLGTGTPVPFPDPPEKTVDVVIIGANRWAGAARRIVAKMGLPVVEVPVMENTYTLCAALGPARILIWPSRIEGMSRIAREARAVGTVPVALNTNTFITVHDHGEGVVLVDDIEAIGPEALSLLTDSRRLASLRDQAIAGARAQADWPTFLARLATALNSVSARRPRPRGIRPGPHQGRDVPGMDRSRPRP